MITDEEAFLLRSKFHGIKLNKERSVDASRIVAYGIPPVIAYGGIFTVMAFWFRYSFPVVAVLVAVIVALAAMGFALGKLRRQYRDGRSIFWGSFLVVFMLLGTFGGFVAGQYVFKNYMDKYYDYIHLQDYKNVDPQESGVLMSDSGRVYFSPESYPDRGSSGCFKNADVYCVAPIVRGGTITSVPVNGTVDFWAIGVNCCACLSQDFRCGAWADPEARAGLRLVNDEQRAFYRLAVEQWVAANGRSSRHPVFYEWVRDPALAEKGLHDSAYAALGYSILVFFLFVLVVAFTLDLWRMHQYNQRLKREIATKPSTKHTVAPTVYTYTQI